MNDKELTSKLSALTSRLDRLEDQQNYHRHIGTDNSQKLSLGGSTSAYGGSVSSSGTLTGQSGWSATNTATGQYTITHNLGTHNYNVSVSIYADSVGYLVVQNLTSTTFDVYTYTTASSAVNKAFTFILAKYE